MVGGKCMAMAHGYGSIVLCTLGIVYIVTLRGICSSSSAAQISCVLFPSSSEPAEHESVCKCE
jgi:hypothetical protein